MFNGQRKELFHHLNLFKNYGLFNLKITEQINKDHLNDSSKNLVKFTNKFLKKVSDNFDSFSYNVIIANLHEMYSF